jgi:hypothetical protein
MDTCVAAFAADVAAFQALPLAVKYCLNTEVARLVQALRADLCNYGPMREEDFHPKLVKELTETCAVVLMHVAVNPLP